MGWKGYHLYSFEIQGREFDYPTKNERLNPELIDDESENSSDVKLLELNLKYGDSFKLIYDFGDNWVHSITFKGQSTLTDSLWGIPICSAGSMNCPPEDCGGMNVYNKIVAMHTKTAKVDLPWEFKASYIDFDIYDTPAVRHINFERLVKSHLRIYNY